MRPNIINLILENIANDRDYQTLSKYIEQLEAHSYNPETHVVIPKKPSDGVLMSMAVRSDHGLAVPGYYDESAFAGSIQFPISHKKRLEGTISSMRQLYEEVAREGFYSDEQEASYVNMLKKSKEGKSHA